MTLPRRLLTLCATLAGGALLALGWWGWQAGDAALLLLGSRLC